MDGISPLVTSLAQPFAASSTCVQVKPVPEGCHSAGTALFHHLSRPRDTAEWSCPGQPHLGSSSLCSLEGMVVGSGWPGCTCRLGGAQGSPSSPTPHLVTPTHTRACKLQQTHRWHTPSPSLGDTQVQTRTVGVAGGLGPEKEAGSSQMSTWVPQPPAQHSSGQCPCLWSAG